MSQNIKKFSIVTVCKNSKDLIEETILSVVNQTIFQKKLATLEYIIIDGYSTDGTTNIILDLKKKYSQILHFTEEDNSLFDGLTKGLKKCTGDFVAYINAGDFYNKTAFEIVNKVFNKNSDIYWITGNKVIYNNNSEITDFYNPYCYRSRLIKAGVYGKYLPFIQQESVFWRINLNKEINFDQLKKLKRCGDLFIWKSFAEKFKLYNVNSHLAGFKYHDNQLTFSETGTTSEYIKESNIFINKISIFDFFLIIRDSFFWACLKYKKFLFVNNSILIDYDHNTEFWDLKKNDNNILHSWISDSRHQDGESKLSITFCQEISTAYDLVIIYSPFNKIIIKNKKIISNVIKKKTNKLNYYYKYISPFIGVFFLWYLHFIKRKKVAYINFLPLWNFLLFILLPSRTILGPITGYVYNDKINSLENFLRKFFLPLFMSASIKIINIKFKNVIFATYNLEKFAKKLSKKYTLNYSSIFINNKSYLEIEKEIDFVIYYRNYNSKKPRFLKLIIEYLSFKGKKIITYGDYFETEFSNIEQKGFIDEKLINNLMNRSKYTIISPENLFSVTFYNALNNRVKIIFDKNLSNDLINQFKQEIFIELDFDDIIKSKDILDQLVYSDYRLSNKFEDLTKKLLAQKFV